GSAPGYLTCEPATLWPSFGGASNTSAPPSGGRWPPWPPSPPAETSTVDTCGVTRDHAAPPFAPLPPAAHHLIPLLADVPQPLMPVAGVLARVQSQVAHHLVF